jgi:hypothetical protein
MIMDSFGRYPVESIHDHALPQPGTRRCAAVRSEPAQPRTGRVLPLKLHAVSKCSLLNQTAKLHTV